MLESGTVPLAKVCFGSLDCLAWLSDRVLGLPKVVPTVLFLGVSCLVVLG